MRILIVTLTHAMFVTRFAEEVETGIDKILTIRKKYFSFDNLLSCDATAMPQKTGDSTMKPSQVALRFGLSQGHKLSPKTFFLK
jgi:hypothetical protein